MSPEISRKRNLGSSADTPAQESEANSKTLESLREAVCGAICPKIHIRRRIRHAFTRRILRYISSRGQSSNSPSRILAFFPVLTLLLTNTSPQANLGQFSDGEGLANETRTSDTQHIEGETEESSESQSNKQPEKLALLYIRVSTSEQDEDGQSLDSQEDELKSVVENREEMKQFGETIVDAGQSGTDFDREGIQKVGRLAQREDITHLLVDTIDRVGRTAPETLMFIDQLRKDYDVKLMRRGREFDMMIPEHRMQAIMLTMMAEFSTMNRARSSIRSSADNFLQKRNWRSWFKNHVPLGYESNDNWIEPIEEWKSIIKEIYKGFIENDWGYTKTAEEVSEEFESASPLKDVTLDDTDVKSIVTKPVYKGSPTIGINYLKHYDENPSVEDESLAFVSEETFDDAQQKVARINEKHSHNDDSKRETVEEYADEFSPHIIEAVSPMVRMLCPSCENTLVSDGRRTVQQDRAQRVYICTNDACDFGEKRWPKESQEEMMELFCQLDDIHNIL